MSSGIMIEGQWTTQRNLSEPSGKFNVAPTTFRAWVRSDGKSGFKAEAGRYHLYVSLACPWAHRTLIMRGLKGLNDAISVSIVDPILGEMGWMFSHAPEAIADSVNHAQYLQEIYLKADPKYTGRVTVPVLWDKQTQTIINNESLEIMRMLDVEFAELATQKVDLYPHELRPEIDQTISAISQSLNVGVYRAGFTTSQAIYEAAVTELFEQLDRWEMVLSHQRYLCGAQLTEADICLFTTLYRFDSVYYSHFKCNLQRVIDYPNLWNYLKDLYQRPEFKATCNMDYIKRGYYKSMTEINPNRIVPKGPILDFDEPHDRNSKITVYRATQADASTLAELGARTILQTYGAAFPRELIDRHNAEAFNTEQIKADLANPEIVYFLTTVNHQGCGYAKLRPTLTPEVITGVRPIELVRLYLDSGWIGQGIGAKLMQTVLDFAVNQGFKTCWLRVVEANDQALAFYRHWGFVEVGSESYLAGDISVTVLLMQLPLKAGKSDGVAQ